MKNPLRAALISLDQATITPKSVGLALAIYAVMTGISLYSSNPFTDGVEEVAALGGWQADQIEFNGGSYGYRIFYSTAEVNVTVNTPDGPVPVHLEMSKLPLGGWSVNHFDRRP